MGQHTTTGKEPGESQPRQVGGGLRVHLAKPARRTRLEDVLTFAVVPGMLLSCVGLMLMRGELADAALIVSTIIAGGFVGWRIGDLL